MICFHSRCSACQYRKCESLPVLPFESPLQSPAEANHLIDLHTTPLPVGQAASEVILATSGKILTTVQECNSLVILVIGPDDASTPVRDNSCIDVMVKAGEGLTGDDIQTLLASIQPHSTVHVRGYPEAFSAVHAPPRSSSDRRGFLHCRELLIDGLKLPVAVATAAEDEECAVPTTTTRKYRKQKNEDRFAKFASFLVAEHGHEALANGSGIMDIAGGSGRLAYELSVRRGIRCCVFDPKTPTLKRSQWKALSERRYSAERLMAVADGSALAEEIASRMLAAEPKFVQHYLTSTSWQPGIGHNRVEEEMSQFYATLPVEAAGAVELSAECVARLLEQASVIVGLHADQATEPVIDLAIAMGKSGAVVPCCIFPTLFSHRRCHAVF